MMRNLYIDRFPRPGHVHKLSRRGAAMTTTKESRKVRCYNCQDFGRIKRDCPSSKEERSATPKWCSLHNSTTYSDAECNAQKWKHNTENQPQGKVQSAHTATESTATEEDDFGYAFVTSGWTPSAEFQETVQPNERKETSADTYRLGAKILTMLMDSGASGHYFDDELNPGLKAKLINYMPLERPRKILTAGPHVLPGTATCTISGKIIDTDGNKHPVEHAGLVAPGRHNRFLALLLLLLLKLEDKTCGGVLCGYSLKSKAYQIYRNKTARVKESRNITFIETPASTLADSTRGDATGDAVSTHEDSSLAENTQDICITYNEEIDSLLKKVSKLTSRNMNHSTLAGVEEPAAEGAGSDEKHETTWTGSWPTNHQLGGATWLGTRANCAALSASPKGLYLHQQRELRNLGLLTSPMVSDAEVAHEK